VLDLRPIHITSDPQTTDAAELRCHDHEEWWAVAEDGLLTVVDRAAAHIRDAHRVHVTDCMCRGEHVIDQRCIPLTGVTGSWKCPVDGHQGVEQVAGEMLCTAYACGRTSTDLVPRGSCICDGGTRDGEDCTGQCCGVSQCSCSPDRPTGVTAQDWEGQRPPGRAPWAKKIPYQIYSRWVKARDRSDKAVWAALQEAYAAGASPHCLLTPGCGFPPHEPDAHPCGTPHRPGDPCRHCGADQDVVDGQVQPCPDCWRPATIADLKGIAAEAGLDSTVTGRG
jgi:hypothetical protein